MNQKYIVKLTETERSQLKELISRGETSAREIRRAYILLKSDSSAGGPSWDYKAICDAYEVSSLTVYNVRKNYTEGGLKRAIRHKKPDREYKTVLDGEAEAHLIAMVCGQPPEGYKQWSLRLIRDRFVELDYVDTISHETIRTTLKKMNLSPG